MAAQTTPHDIGLLGFASPLDALALILFVLFSVRRLELGRATAADYPRLPAANFEAWKRRRMRLHLVAALACSLKPLLGTILPYLELRFGVPLRVVWATGAIVDPTFVVVVVVVAIKIYRSTTRAA